MTPTVYIHMGPYKTGSTTIQHNLWRNRETLLKRGLAYPDENLVFFSHSNVAAELAGLDSFGAKFNRLYDLESFARDWQKDIVLSSEVFSEITDKEQLQKLKAAFDPSHRVKVIVYLRRQDALLESMWKSFYLSKLVKIAFQDWLDMALQRYAFLKYDIWLDQLSEIFGRDNLDIYFYKSRNQNLFSNFVALCGVENTQGLDIVKRAGSSPNALTVTLLQSLYLNPYGDGVNSGLIRPGIAEEDKDSITKEIQTFLKSQDIPAHYSLYDQASLKRVRNFYKGHNAKAALRYFNKQSLFPEKSSVTVAPDSLLDLLSKEQIATLGRRILIRQTRFEKVKERFA